MRLRAKTTTPRALLLSPLPSHKSSTSLFFPRSPAPPTALPVDRPPLQLTKSFFSPSRLGAQERHTLSDVVEISGTRPHLSPEEVGLPGGGRGPPDERTLKLGKTLRILQSRLPTLLAKPLPTEILSPHISLHLFPSTHPHLPKVSGRVAYHAALWTSPITWGRVPLIGNVKLKIVSERMMKNGPSYHSQLSQSSDAGAKGAAQAESLIVRWKTCGKEHGNGSNAVLGKMAEWLGRDMATGASEGSGVFDGLFIFEFDEDGRILSHTIERVEQGGNWDAGVGKWIGLTDWLLGRIGGKGEMQPGLALGYVRHEVARPRRFERN